MSSTETKKTQKKAAKKKAAKKKTAKKKAAKKKTAKKKKAAKKKTAKKKKAAKKKTAKKKTAGSTGTKSAKALVVVESPAKAKTINKFLGKNYLVVASMGHVRDLVKRTLGVNIDDRSFEPEYEPLPEKKKVISELRKHARGASTIYLACDMDREGEAIAWHISELLRGKKKAMRRVVFNQITAAAIQKAFEEPRDLDMKKVNAQQARRILDRIVGYKLSQLLWKKVRRGLSAGRVQSVATKMVVEREKEIQAFVPVEYWEFAGLFDSPRLRDAEGGKHEGEEPPPWQFQANLAQLRGNKLDPAGFRIANEEQARELEEKLRTAPFAITSVAERETRRNPRPPFKTSTLQQTASTRLSFGTDRTMRVAQALYEGVELGGEGATGLITYMRTDSLALAPEAVEEARGFIETEFGPNYLPDKPRAYKPGKKAKVQAQEAHEAIRPTSVHRTPDALKGFLTDEQLRLYTLIWSRFVACQMKPALFKSLTVEVTGKLSEAEGDEALFRASGQRLLFDGFLRVLGRDQTDRLLPALEEGETLVLAEPSEGTQKFTKPPARYNEASLVKKLEEEGIGRPSTYASIISTIQKREYVSQVNRALHATTKGMIVTEKLEAYFGDIMEYKYTRDLETNLDRVEGDLKISDEEEQETETLSELDWRELLREFYDDFSADLAKADTEMKHVNDEPELTEYPCPQCGKPMQKLYNTREFTQFLGCSDYKAKPQCKTTVPLDEEGNPMPEVESDETCPKCGLNLVLRSGRRGRFFACSGYPDCKQTFELGEDGKPVPRPEVEADCPECEETMIVRYGRRGPFLGCPTYPKCRGTLPLIKKEDGTFEVGQRGAQQDMPQVDVKCEICGSPMSIKRSRRGPFLGCSTYPKCRHTAKLPADVKLPKRPEPKPLGEDCEQCGKPLVIREGRRGPFIACSGYPACKNTRNIPAEGLAK